MLFSTSPSSSHWTLSHKTITTEKDGVVLRRAIAFRDVNEYFRSYLLLLLVQKKPSYLYLKICYKQIKQIKDLMIIIRNKCFFFCSSSRSFCSTIKFTESEIKNNIPQKNYFALASWACTVCRWYYRSIAKRWT